eukprot:Nk52_evm3s559 gene=Nk52_evmTU3s559
MQQQQQQQQQQPVASTQQQQPAAAVPAPNSAAAQAAAGFSSTSLYVGDLHPDVTEATLFEIFNAVGPVASIRVCRDAVTRRSLTYAYVNFHNPVDAERALDTMNYSMVKGNPMRIMWSQRDPSVRKSGVGNIFIKNLDKSIDNKALYDTFSAFGNILSCKVVCDENGSKGYGFVHYDTNESADTAIEKVNGMLLNGTKVFVGNFISSRERADGKADPNETFTNVFVKNLPEEWNTDKVKEVFGECGPIISATVMDDGEGKSRCFGFVCFENHESAAKAVETLNNKEFDSKNIYVGRAQKKSEREAELKQKYEQMKMERANRYQGVNLYVKNIDDTIEDERLRQEFATYGTITSAKIMRDDKGNSKGFGFVCFSSPEEATKAVTEMNGRIFVSKPLYVALAQRRDDRKQQLAAQYNQRVAGVRMQQAAAGVPQGMPQYPQANPMFYQGPGMVPGPQRPMPGMYGPAGAAQMQQAGGVRPRWAPPAGGYQAMPGYVNVNGMPVRGGPQGVRNNRGGPRGNQQGAPRNGMPGQGVMTQVQQQAGGPQQMQGPKGQRGFKYNTNVRNNAPTTAAGIVAGNAPVQKTGDAANSGEQPQQNGQAATGTQEPLTASVLADATHEVQKQILGERLFPLIQANHPELAAKITGMLLEMDNSELLHLLESQEALDLKVNEALVVLKTHGQGNGVDVNAAVEVDA